MSQKRPGDRLAVALADGFLGVGPQRWTTRDLVQAGVEVFGRPRPWLTRLVAEVLDGYRRPPVDAPGEFAAYLRRCQAFAEVAADSHGLRGSGRRLGRRLFRSTADGVPRFGVPRIDDVPALADLLGLDLDELSWFADPQLRLRRASSSRLQHYRYRWIPGSRSSRLLETPMPRIKALQRTVLDRVLSSIPVHPAAHGFVTGRSAITGARPHVGAHLLISLDMESFFSAITAGRVFGLLRWAGLPEAVAHLMAGLLTHATPVAVISRMPASPDPDRSHRLRRRLATPHLPQGAPSSPMLANLIAFGLDRRLHDYAQACGLTYTRYADDLTFSGGPAAWRRRQSMLTAVEAITAAEGFTVNHRKTRVRRSGTRQLVTGIVVNHHPNVPRPDYDRLRAIVHNCLVHGPESQNRNRVDDFRAHLAGRVAWVAALDPARGAKLTAEFDQIGWLPARPAS